MAPRKNITSNIINDEPKPSLHAAEAPDLSADEIAQVEQEAAADAVALKKKQQKAALKKKLVKQALKAGDPSQEMRSILIDLAGHSDKVTIDGFPYYHGQTYNVTKAVYDTLVEVGARGWKHEAEIGGANANAYRQPRNVTLRPGA